MPNPFATRPPGHFARLDVTNEEYHAACDGVSNSMLSVFLDDPALFYGRYVAGHYAPPASTPDQQFGSLVHEILLENRLSRLVEIPAAALSANGSRTGKAWQAFLADIPPGTTPMKPDEIAVLRQIRRNCEDHPEAAKLLFENDGENETTVEWTDPGTGLLLRSRRDRVTTYNGRRVIVDVKTCPKNDPKSFAESCFRWGYHRQQAFYCDSEEACYNETVAFAFVAIRKTPPYTVRVYDLDGEFASLGEDELYAGLERLAQARDTNIWHAPDAHQILTLSCPRWAKFSEWEMT